MIDVRVARRSAPLSSKSTPPLHVHQHGPDSRQGRPLAPEQGTRSGRRPRRAWRGSAAGRTAPMRRERDPRSARGTCGSRTRRRAAARSWTPRPCSRRGSPAARPRPSGVSRAALPGRSATSRTSGLHTTGRLMTALRESPCAGERCAPSSRSRPADPCSASGRRHPRQQGRARTGGERA